MKIKKLLACALTAGMMLSFMPATAMADSEGWVEEKKGFYPYIFSCAGDQLFRHY